MKKYLLILILSGSIYSQKVLVIDSTTQKPIPFVTIQFNSTDGTYSNENGFFEMTTNKTDTIAISHITYSTLLLKASDVKDTIRMSPNAVILKEVVITNKNKITKYIDFPKSKSSFSSWPVNPKSEMISLIIPSSENAASQIQKLNFSFVKKKEKNINLSNQTAIRVNIYGVTKNKTIENKIYGSEVLFINPTKKDFIVLDLEKDFIEFSENGLYIGLEVLGDISDSGEIIEDNAFIHVKLTDNVIADYYSETFIKYVFDSKLNLIPINEIINKTSGKIIERNLSFGITILKPN